MSEVYKTKNPYYKDPADESDENPAEQLPVNAEATKPGSATGTVTEHTKTDSDGNTTSQTSPAEQKKQAMAEADASEKGENEDKESKQSGQGKEFYTIQTASDKVFYLIIDRDGEEEMVYFLTEITENDLLNTTSDNSETLPKNSAALESAIPTSESALPNNNAEQENKQEEAAEDTEGTEEDTESTEEPEETEVKEQANPMISYILMGGLAVAVIGGAYYFKAVRKRKRISSRMKMRTRKITKNMRTKMRNQREVQMMISLRNRRKNNAVSDSGKAKCGTVNCQGAWCR